MVEFAMIFGLGFLTATMLSLLAGPLVVRRAKRRARIALERSLPLTLDEIAAAKDQLSASHAVALRVVEQRADTLNDRLASAMADAGRQLARAVEADGRYAEASAKADTLATALATAEEATEAARRTIQSRTAALEETTTVADQRAAALATANERVSAVETMIAGQRKLLEEFGQRLAVQAEPAEEESGPPATSPSAAAPPDPPESAVERQRAVEMRLRSETATLRRAEALSAAERDRLRLRVDELLLRVSELEEEAGEAAERAEADRREQMRQTKSVASLTKRIATRDDSIKALKRQLSAAAGGRAPVPTTNAGFREAIATLAAELVSFAEKDARERPETKSGKRR